MLICWKKKIDAANSLPGCVNAQKQLFSRLNELYTGQPKEVQSFYLTQTKYANKIGSIFLLIPEELKWIPEVEKC